ncbi:MAG: hypothetical protein KDA42_13880 [Planctomycetales bacterium]|nr:hypothetical protein [Planctomycetales bacterium]
MSVATPTFRQHPAQSRRERKAVDGDKGELGPGSGDLIMRFSTLIVFTSLLLAANGSSAAERSRFAETGSRSQYVHWIELYDANFNEIDPAAEHPAPYSPRKTCGRCHDYDTIACGYHFNARADDAAHGRPGEPWIWNDPRTATQLPLSYRGWAGTYDPRRLDISAWDFALKFGRHLPGGVEPAASSAPLAAAEGAPPEPATPGNWTRSGALEIDCMICHAAESGYSMEAWAHQIDEENFAWAPTAGLGIGSVTGAVADLDDDGAGEGPQVTYHDLKRNGEGKVFFNVVRQPRNDTCYYCHSNRTLGGPQAAWNHDEDIHLRAGMQCADCHRNGIGHHTVRGFAGEQHASGEAVVTLSCRGCHLGEEQGGRLGAPQPLHAGLPPLHLEKLSCTACHSGPLPGDQALPLQTALAHGLGLPSHDYTAELPPELVAPVFLRDGETLFPHRMMWPSFWGAQRGETIVPAHPEAVYDALRRTFRVRRGKTLKETLLEIRLGRDDKTELLGEERAGADEDEWTEEEQARVAAWVEKKALADFQEKLPEAFEALAEVVGPGEAKPVFVAGGKVYRLDSEGHVETFAHAAAEPYAWKLAHDVRPARASLGAGGCFDCHAEGAPIFAGKVATPSPVPSEESAVVAMQELAGYDKTKLDAWNQSFQGRAAFKWLGFASMGVVGFVLLSGAVWGFLTVTGVARRKD